jgi:hypothetical protein
VTSIVELLVRGPAEPWERIGLRVDDGATWIGGVSVRFTGEADVAGLSGWTLLRSLSTPALIDGLATAYVDDAEPQFGDHPLGVTSIDHVVAMTSSVERTCGEIERVTGEPLKRIREAGSVRQGFHRLGSTIVEVVESGRTTSPVAEFWGFVMVVDDLHEVAGRLGPDVLSAPRTAVQAGRQIASFRSDVGLGLPVALMSPHVR